MLLPKMPSDDTAGDTGRERRAALRLKALLDQAERGAKARLGRRLQEEGYDSGEQLPRKYAAGIVTFTRASQRVIARAMRELGIAQIPDDYFERDDDPGSAGAAVSTRHASLARVLERHAYRNKTVEHLLAYDRDLSTDDPGERHWEDIAAVIEGVYAADEARRGPPTKPRGTAPSRRR